MILECCQTAKAKTLITGDKDLLDISDLPFELRIMTAHAFIED
jgi:predicted nucleic acid-binding protein